MYSLSFAEVDNVLLWEGRMVLDLIDSWYDCRVWEKLFEVADGIVGDADSLDFSGGQQLFH
jgi:hypothetical protein